MAMRTSRRALGKKSLPSHFVALETRGRVAAQLHSKWMEGWDYTHGKGEFDLARSTQFEYVVECCKAFGVDMLQYDATRGGLDTLKDANLLPDSFEGVTFTKERMVAMATTLSDRITHQSVRLLDDPRQTNRMLPINNMQAIESPQEHGRQPLERGDGIPRARGTAGGVRSCGLDLTQLSR